MTLQPRPDGSYNLRESRSDANFNRLQRFAKRHGIRIGDDGTISHDDFHRLLDCVRAENALSDDPTLG